MAHFHYIPELNQDGEDTGRGEYGEECDCDDEDESMTDRDRVSQARALIAGVDDPFHADLQDAILALTAWLGDNDDNQAAYSHAGTNAND